MNLKIENIRIDGGTQSRASIDSQTVQEYADAMEDGVKFPPIMAYHDGTTHWLAEGFHRILAAQRLGFRDFPAEVRKGTRIDALRHSLGANSDHGRRRTNADIAYAIKLAYENRKALGLPDVPAANLIAQLVHVTDKTAAVQLRNFRSWAQAPARTGADGRTRNVPPPPPPPRPMPPPPQRPVKTATPPPPPTPTPPTENAVNAQSEGPFDSFMRAIPEALRPMWERRGEIDALKSKVSDVRVALRNARDRCDPLFAGIPQDVLTWLDNTHGELDNCKPFIVCPWCGGLSGTCKMCRGPRRGFVSRFQWNTFATDEMKAMIEKGLR